MSHEASGMKSSDLTVALDALLPKYDLRSAWASTRYAIAFSDTGTDGGDEEEQEEGGDGDGDDGDGDGSGSAGKDKTGKDIKDPEKKRLSDEAAAARVAKREAEAKVNELAARLKEFEDKDKGEVELLQAKSKEQETIISTLQGTVQQQAIRLAFFESGAAAQFRDPSVALRLLKDDLKDIEVDEDGSADADAIKSAAEALLATSPYLKVGGDGDDGDDDDEPSNPSGRKTNGKKKSKDELSKEALAKKFPALRR